METTEPETPATRPGRAWSTVLILAALYIMSYVDRGVLALVVEPLKADLGLSDLSVGLLYGTAFAVFYSLLGVPIARLADMSNRRRLIIAGVVLWGLCTVASGFVASFAALVVLRMGLAVGEAALTPAAFSMIGDMFPAERRAFASSVYKALGTVGIGGGMILVGFVIHYATAGVESGSIGGGFRVWQLVFIAVGAPALALALVFALFCREPVRRKVAGANAGPSNRELLAHLRANRRLYLGLFCGAGFMQAIAGVFNGWGPEFMRRTYDWEVTQIAATMGVLTMVTSLVATLSAPLITRYIQKRGREDSVLLVAIFGAVVGTLCAIVAYSATDVRLFIPFYLASAFLLSGGSNNVMFSLQDLAPPRMLGTLICILIALFNLFALGFGPPIAAAFSDLLSPTGEKLGLAIVIQTAICGAAAVVLLSWAHRGIARTRAAGGSILRDAAPLQA